MADNKQDQAPVAEPEVTKTQGAAAQPDAPADVDVTGGRSEGTVEKTDESIDVEVRNRIEHEEKIVYDKDESGNVIGFHKEPADGSTPEEQKAVVASLSDPTQEETEGTEGSDGEPVTHADKEGDK